MRIEPDVVNKQIRCLAVDDEPLALEVLKNYIGRVPSFTLVAACGNSLDALARVHQGDIDLIFLDIQMPDLTGMQFLRILNGRCKVILTTAYQEYALEGYEYAVLDYLLKPIPFERFLKSIQRAADHANGTPEVPLLHVPKEESSPPAPDFIFVKVENRIVKVDLEEILFVSALKDYVKINTISQTILSLQTMSKMEQMLPVNRFVRVHKSYVVALDKIQTVERQRIYINKEVIPVGDTYQKDFMRKLNRSDF